MRKKDEKSQSNHATLIFERKYKIFKEAKKNEKKLTQQRNTDFHTSLFCHQKKLIFLLIQKSYLMQRCHTYLETYLLKFWKKDEKSWCNHATLIFERIYKIFKEAKKMKKNWRNNATLIFTHLYSATKKSWVSSLYRSPILCNDATHILKRTYLILKKKDEKSWRNHATLIFERIYQII